MAKKAAATNWQSAKGTNFSDDMFRDISTGLHPLWVPEKDNVIFFLPKDVEVFKVKKGSKKKNGAKPNFAIHGTFLGGETLNFFSGKNKPATVKQGDTVTLGSSHNLVGADKLIQIDEKSGTASLSEMSEKVIAAKACFRIRFDGKISIGGGRTVNQFVVGVPKDL